MAQILAPSTQWQMRITKPSTNASPMTAKMWGSLLLKQNKKGPTRSSSKFRVLALKSDNGTINRVEDLLNLDITPFTDKIIAEYIWYNSSYFANNLYPLNLPLLLHVSVRPNVVTLCCFGTGLEVLELICVASQGYELR